MSSAQLAIESPLRTDPLSMDGKLNKYQLMQEDS